MRSASLKIRHLSVKNNKDFLILAGLLVVTAATIYPIQVFGDKNYTAPSWVKVTSKWWSEGKISTQDYISGLQYLAAQNLIKMPTTLSPNINTSGNRTAQSYIVHIISGREHVFYGFSKFNNLNQPLNGMGQDQTTGSQVYYQPQFQLEGLVSEDNKEFYNLISNYLKDSPSIQPYNMNIDVVAGDGSIIETLYYTKCAPYQYNIYSNDDSSLYRMGNSTTIEIRDQTTFLCSGFQLGVPQ